MTFAEEIISYKRMEGKCLLKNLHNGQAVAWRLCQYFAAQGVYKALERVRCPPLFTLEVV